MMRLQAIHLFDLKASNTALLCEGHFSPTRPRIKPKQIGHFVTRTLNRMLIPIKQVANPAGIICNVPRLLVFFVIGAKMTPFVNAAEGFNETLLPALAENCIKCHGKDDKIKGDLNLLEISNSDDLLSTPHRIQDLIDVLEFEEMPPEEEPPLSAESRQEIIAELQALMKEAIAARTSFPKTPIRRMNRFQYNNAVQDLFELNVEVFTLPERMLREYGDYFKPQTGIMPSSLKAGSRPLGKSQMIEPRLAGVGPFPQDLRAEHGYDNQADHLSISPLLMESFLKLSRSIVESDDFNEDTCGVWHSFFTPPATSENLSIVISNRLRSFLTRAFREPVDESTLNRYAESALQRIQSGETYTDAMKMMASAALASPRFLYLRDQPVTEGKMNAAMDTALASRLSYFLWGSIPDPILLEKAVNGELSNPRTLVTEVERMLRDERLKRFCDSFPGQWLQLDRIITSTPDRDTWPGFYHFKYRGSMHMMLEPLLLFETILIENRSILELIDSTYSYQSKFLKTWYQEGGQSSGMRVPVVQVPFERVLLEDRRQGGVITNAAVMTMTSSTSRTKPITRGAWIASVIFKNPPEPPPADVPPLPEKSNEVDIESLTLRERLDVHRENLDCAGCHNRIDPLGFALENYGPAGLWREKYENGRIVNTAGKLFRKHAFQNIVEFKDAILAEKERFTRAFAAHVLSFALGRELDIADSPSLDQIAQATIDDEFQFHTLIKEIVLSESFLQPAQSSEPKVAQQSR